MMQTLYNSMNKTYKTKNRTLAQYVKDSLLLDHVESIEIKDKKDEIKKIQIG